MPALVYPRPAAQLGRRPPDLGLLLGARAGCTPTPRSPSGGGAGACSRGQPAAHTLPWWSAITWTSTWRASVICRSRNTVGSPKAWRASVRAISKAPASSAGVRRPADAPAAAAGGRLDEAAGSRCARRRRTASSRSATGPPLHGMTGTPGLLGQPLVTDLVADPSHGVTGGADEDDAELVAQVGELGVLGDEAPTDPGRLRPGRDQGPLEPLVVEIGERLRPERLVERGGRADAHRLVGLADEPGVPVGLGVERDGRQPVAAGAVELGRRR